MASCAGTRRDGPRVGDCVWDLSRLDREADYRGGSGTPGGGFHELGEKLLQVLNTDLDEQRLEAPVAFQKVESRGPRQNLQHLADRKAQLGIAVEGLTVKTATSRSSASLPFTLH